MPQVSAPERLNKVLMIYTGGTIGMKETQKGFVPVPGYLSSLLTTLRNFHEPSQPLYTTPLSKYGTRIHFDVLEYDPLLDSSNMTPTEWLKIASDIEKNYELYDGFVVLHGTDTMSYTASALSFMLENLHKTVILTGSQIPLALGRSDAEENLLSALTIAGNFVIPEVSLYFRSKLYRGNRTSKVDASGLDAFASGNYPPLAEVGVDISVNWERVRKIPTTANFRVQKELNVNVACLRLFPGISSSLMKNFLAPPTQAVVLETYGAGNAPDQRTDLLDCIKEATHRGVVIVNCTQCFRGAVKPDYATGVALADAGVTSGLDMTPEAALTKLMYLLGKGYLPEKIRELIQQPLRGELKSQNEIKVSFRERDFIRVISRALYTDDSDQQAHFQEIALVLSPTLMCSAAAVGSVDDIAEMICNGVSVNTQDYDGRTALHLAASEGHTEVVRFLLSKGANVNMVDRWGGTPLDDAIRHHHKDIAQILKDHGAKIEVKNTAAELIRACQNGDIAALSQMTQDYLSLVDHDGRTALHVSSASGHANVVEYILKQGQKDDLHLRDKHGNTALDYAMKGNFADVVQILVSFSTSQQNNQH